MKSSHFLAALALIGIGSQAYAQDVVAADSASTENKAPSLDDLDQRISVLERVNEIAAEDKEANAPKVTKVQADDKGFGLSNFDDSFKLRLRGFAQTVGLIYPKDSADQFKDRFLVRRLRPVLEGTYAKDFSWKVQADFAGSVFTLLDAYLDWKIVPWLTLRSGKFKGPLVLERLQSPSKLQFVDRGFPTSFGPNREVGVQATVGFGEYGQFDLALVNGAKDGASITEDANNSDVNDNEAVDARLFLTPFKTSDFFSLQGLGFGVAGSYGKLGGTPSSYKTSGLNTFFSPIAAAAATATSAEVKATSTDSLSYRVIPQAYWSWGRFAALGEYALTHEVWGRINSKGVYNSSSVYNSAWQGTLSVFLTDTEADYWNGAKVKKNTWNPSEGGFGAWELAGRVQGVKFDDRIFTGGYADSLKSASSALAWTVGLNWYINPQIKWVLNYERTTFEGGNSYKQVQSSTDAKGKVTTKTITKLSDRLAEDLIATSFNFSW